MRVVVVRFEIWILCVPVLMPPEESRSQDLAGDPVTCK